MLARVNRLVSAEDYRRLVRRGQRQVSGNMVVYSIRAPSQAAVASRPPRIGFIVPKAVGVAVDRNLVRRRLKAVGHELLTVLPPGTEIVIRALPGAAQVRWDTLRTEVADALVKGVMRS